MTKFVSIGLFAFMGFMFFMAGQLAWEAWKQNREVKRMGKQVTLRWTKKR